MGGDKKKALDSNAPSLVYERNIIKRTLRDTYDNDTKNVYIEGNKLTEQKNSWKN